MSSTPALSPVQVPSGQAPPVQPPPVRTAPRADGSSTEAATARKFEAVFLGQMAQMMMGTVDGDGPFSGGHGEEMFRGVLAEQLGTAMAAKGGLGLAPAVMDQIIKLQGGSGHVD